MRSLLRPAVAVCAVLALAVPLAVVSPAQAAGHQPLNQRALANSSLGAADVPRWMMRGGTPEVDRTFLKKDAAPAPDLCLDADGEEIRGPKPRQYMGSMVNTRVNLDDFQFIEINSDIYQYKSRAAAVQAWSELQAGVARCVGYIDVDVEEEGMRVRVAVTTEISSTQALFGTPGIALFQDVDLSLDGTDLEIAIIGDQYATYYLAGTSIIRVEFANINGDFRGIGRVSQGFVQTMAIVVAQRVERRSTR